MASGTIVKNVVEYIVNQIVEDTKSVKVDVADSDDENAVSYTHLTLPTRYRV